MAARRCGPRWRDVWDWVVVTSANGAERAVAAAGGRAAALAVPWAVVGPATADGARARRHRAALVPDRFVAEGLLEALPAPPPAAAGRSSCRPSGPTGARRRAARQRLGRVVVVAYRTVAARRPADVLAAALRRRHRFHIRLDGRRVRPRGRRGGAAARRRRHRPGDGRGRGRATGWWPPTADPHSLDGLVAAPVAALR